jgi:hypothetical protein
VRRLHQPTIADAGCGAQIALLDGPADVCPVAFAPAPVADRVVVGGAVDALARRTIRKRRPRALNLPRTPFEVRVAALPPVAHAIARRAPLNAIGRRLLNGRLGDCRPSGSISTARIVAGFGTWLPASGWSLAARRIVARRVAIGAAFAKDGAIVPLAVGGKGRRGNAGKKQNEHQLTHGHTLGTLNLCRPSVRLGR